MMDVLLALTILFALSFVFCLGWAIGSALKRKR